MCHCHLKLHESGGENTAPDSGLDPRTGKGCQWRLQVAEENNEMGVMVCLSQKIHRQRAGSSTVTAKDTLDPCLWWRLTLAKTLQGSLKSSSSSP
ncbi:hypothetical protein AV530_013321 [Patagioenas fasciata monilis]|uniref:Uncharacterized protein n=1 Tax=Patagioenas fasciata monilis TaxID=372326 RepID=A0A1V4JNY5_PATFA|nr:hypothetical protein AV530_013321 [Patagioenas fasciata monilis]